MMAKRMILMLAVVITLLAGLGFVKYRQIQAAVAQNGNFQPPPEPESADTLQIQGQPAVLLPPPALVSSVLPSFPRVSLKLPRQVRILPLISLRISPTYG